MGANSFFNVASCPKDTPNALQHAFRAAVSDARYEHGSGGYTGTLAEKHDVRLLCVVANKQEAERVAADVQNSYDNTCLYRESVVQLPNDKWGPAIAIQFPLDAKTLGFIFFGSASS